MFLTQFALYSGEYNFVDEVYSKLKPYNLIQVDGEAKIASNARYKHSDTPVHDDPDKLSFLNDSIISF